MRRQLLEDIGDLEALGDADAGELMLRQTGDVAPLEADASLGRREQAADDIEESALAGAVGADDGGQLARLESHADLVQRHEITEALGDVFNFKYRQAHGFSIAALRASQCNTEPQTPLGKNSTKNMKTTPTSAIQ